MTSSAPPKAANARTAHPMVAPLVGGLDLSPSALEAREDAASIQAFVKMLANAEYWLGFDLASFETLLAHCPSPIRELGVAVLLRYSEDVGGTLGGADIARALEDLQGWLPEDLLGGVRRGLDTLARAVEARDARPDFVARGFFPYRQEAGLNVHALRAMGSAQIQIQGVEQGDGEPTLALGVPVEVRATDERGRPMEPPEIENALRAEALMMKGDKVRTVIFLVPGEYTLRVPSKATGHRKVLVG